MLFVSCVCVCDLFLFDRLLSCDVWCCSCREFVCVTCFSLIPNVHPLHILFTPVHSQVALCGEIPKYMIEQGLYSSLYYHNDKIFLRTTAEERAASRATNSPNPFGGARYLINIYTHTRIYIYIYIYDYIYIYTGYYLRSVSTHILSSSMPLSSGEL